MLENPRFSALENLSLQGCVHKLSEINNDHLKQISQLKLKHLSMSKISILMTKPELFSQVMNRIETVHLIHMANSTKTHVEEFFNLLNSGSSIKRLRLDNWHWFDATEIEPDVVGTALNKLEQLEIYSTNLENEHLRCLFRKINDKTRLKSVDFWNLNLSNIR